MTWFRRSPRGRHSAPVHPAVASPVLEPVVRLGFADEPVVHIGFADNSLVTLPPADPRTRAFVALADALRGSSGSPVRPI